MTPRTAWLALVWLAGCAADTRACDELCDNLVDGCGFAAFPDAESCRQGCAWEASNGADLVSYGPCVAASGCDPFAVAACARAHGAP